MGGSSAPDLLFLLAIAYSPRAYAAVGPGSSSEGTSSLCTGAQNSSGITFGSVRLTRSTLTMCVRPAAKKGIRLPTFSPINATPSGDNTGIWVPSDVYFSGYTNCLVSRGPPQSAQYVTHDPIVTI